MPPTTTTPRAQTRARFFRTTTTPPPPLHRASTEAVPENPDGDFRSRSPVVFGFLPGRLLVPFWVGPKEATTFRVTALPVRQNRFDASLGYPGEAWTSSNHWLFRRALSLRVGSLFVGISLVRIVFGVGPAPRICFASFVWNGLFGSPDGELCWQRRRHWMERLPKEELRTNSEGTSGDQRPSPERTIGEGTAKFGRAIVVSRGFRESQRRRFRKLCAPPARFGLAVAFGLCSRACPLHRCHGRLVCRPVRPGPRRGRADSSSPRAHG